MRAIPATRGYVAIVDEEDFYWLSAFKWRAVQTDKTGGRRSMRPVRSLLKHEGGKAGETILLYRQIMRPPPGLVVDHIDGDPWNNRRSNLRVCTQAQNGKNRRILPGSLKGVVAGVGTFRARISIDGKSFNFGRFGCEREAALAYDAAALALHGEFASLNFPDAGTAPRHPYEIHEECFREENEAKARLVSDTLDHLRRGLTVRATAKAVGVNRSVVWRWAQEHGLFLTRCRPRNVIIDRGIISPAPSSRAGAKAAFTGSAPRSPVGAADLPAELAFSRTAAAAGSPPFGPVVAGNCA